MTQHSRRRTPRGSRPRNLRKELLHQRYLLKDTEGQAVETPREMLIRVAGAIAAAEAQYGAAPAEIQAVGQRFFRLMRRGLFLPNSPTLMNAGRPKGMLCACFVLGMEDSLAGIFEAVRRTAFVQGVGGGTGFDLDVLRPAGDLIASTGGRTSGPIGFWRVIAEASKAITQGAHRRAANMAVMSIWHPDILSFIGAKENPGHFTNFNISVKIPAAFMAALQAEPDSPHLVTNRRTGRKYALPRSLAVGRYDLRDLIPAGEANQQCYTVRDIWHMIIANAHATGEPGVCFIDRVNRDNPVPALGRIVALNACGEQPLSYEEACCLGSIDVSRFIAPDGRSVDWAALREAVTWALRFLDNVLDVTHYPIPEIREVTQGNRKVGLGVMGFADALIRLGLRYDSEEAIRFGAKVSSFIQDNPHRASQELAEQRGGFPNWAGSVWDTEHHRPMRNATCTTIAPTGSISILAGCSSGIEPIYSLAYLRRGLDGREFVQVHPLLDKMGRRQGWMGDAVREALLEGVPATEIPTIPRPLAESLVTAHEVAPEMHVRMQAAFQENVDNAVSKTVNLPADAVVSDVDRIFRTAFGLGCKGITVYRDGSREGQTLSSASSAGSASPQPQVLMEPEPRPRSRVTHGSTSKFRMGCGTLFVTVNRDDQGLCEVFANLGKAGGCPSQSEATCRAVSTALRCGVDPREMIDQLRGIRCLSAAMGRKDGDGTDVLSCPDAIAKAIEEAVDGPREEIPLEQPVGDPCPDCGAPLRREAGCLVCSCGYSNCG